MIEATAVTHPEQAIPAERAGRFCRFVDAHRERALRLAWRLAGGDPALAEDLVQESLCRAYQALPRFREESSFETWFYRILVRQAQKHRRRMALRSRWMGLWKGEPADPSAKPLPDLGLQRRIAAALDALPRGQREVFVLVHLEGFTVKQAAQIAGKPIGTVKSHLHRALRTLRSELADLRASEERGPRDEA